MPHFGLGSPLPQLRSPEPGTPRNTLLGLPSPSSAHSTHRSRIPLRHHPARLSCLGQDGHTLYICQQSKVGMTTKTTFQYMDLMQDDEEDMPPTQLRLPDHVVRALEVDPPMELLCVGKKTLCLYSAKAAFLLTLNEDGDQVMVQEPLNQIIGVFGFDETIVRIRAAPRASMASPSGSMAVLLYHAARNEYQICLCHANIDKATNSTSTTTTIPVRFALEDLSERDPITDFCFLSCPGPLHLLASMAVALVHASGTVMLATPCVFHGSVVSRGDLRSSMDYLETACSTSSSLPHRRQARAALQYLRDAWKGTTTTPFATANIILDSENSATSWPVCIQGPIMEPLEGRGGITNTIEAISSDAEDVAGLVVARRQGAELEYGVISATACIPRFDFEDRLDWYELNDSLPSLANWIESLSLEENEEEEPLYGHKNKTCSLLLLPDPIIPTLLHCAAESWVATVSTNVMRVTSMKLRGIASSEAVSTNAWVTWYAEREAETLTAVVVPEGYLHHHLILRANGQLQRINVRQAQAMHEMEKAMEAAENSSRALVVASSSSDPSSNAVPALYEITEPLVKRVLAGLAGMKKIVGSHTPTDQLTPEILASALQLAEKHNKNLILPMLELRKVVEARKATFRKTIQDQMEQLSKIAESIEELEKQREKTGVKLDRAESNGLTLRQRAEAVVQACQDHVPTITKAEQEFFNDMKRLDLRCTTMEKEMEQLRMKIQQPNLEDIAVSDRLKNLDAEQVKNIKMVLANTGNQLQAIQKRLKVADLRTQDVARKHGIGDFK